MSKRSLFLLLAGILFGAVTVWVHYEVKVNLSQRAELGGGGSVEESGNLVVGEDIADFASIDLAGANVTLSEFENREVVVLDFWASWCQPCISSMPSLEALNEEFDGRGAMFLAVNVGEGTGLVEEFVAENEFGVRVVMDEYEEITDSYGVRGIPQLVIVDTEGRVAHIERGYPPIPGLAEEREQRLREKLRNLTRGDGA